MLNIVLFGAPGCGKGTQAARLKEKYGIDHVSTGNVIREEIARGTKLGKEMESYITTGRLAPDQVVIDMIADYIAAHKHAKGNIFDGFPRTTHQAEEFDRMLSEQGLKVDVMIYMDVPEEELVKRILLRGKESGRADDASEEGSATVSKYITNRRPSSRTFTPNRENSPTSTVWAPWMKSSTASVRSSIPFGSNSDLIHIYFTGFLRQESRCFILLPEQNSPRSPRKTRLAPDTPGKRHAPPSFRPNAPAPDNPSRQTARRHRHRKYTDINRSCRR